MIEEKQPRKDFNYFITKFFLNNGRLTFLISIFFIAVSVSATLSLKITGFPNVDTSIALIQTLYPGASSETVAKEVTIPLEASIKNIEGVKRYSSTTTNSLSLITVTLDEGLNSDIIKPKLDNSVKNVDLPSSVETPNVSKLEIGQADAIYSIISPSLDKTYTIKTEAEKILSQISSVSKVQKINDIKRNVQISLNAQKMQGYGITSDTVKNTLATFNEEIPSVSGVDLDNQKVSISTSIKDNDYNDLENLSFIINPVSNNPQQTPQQPTIPSGNNNNPNPNSIPNPSTNQVQTVKLKDFAKIAVIYDFETNPKSYLGVRENNGNANVQESFFLGINFASDADQSKAIEEIKTKLSEIKNTQYLTLNELEENYSPKSSYIIEGYSSNDDNQKQINEVVSGLIGGKIESLGSFSWLGYALGGIQLVMLVMIALVSWRAAIISALAIPLSFLFSTFYLYLVGESLNTLTLFSLVLVTGLVVDPALVVLEAIQRKIDSGLKRKEAVLEAIKDIGMGVFLAMLTNVIVFVPFGLVTGIFGAIFKFIPLTVIPAIVGSYLVPIVVLAWLASFTLKKNNKLNGSEEDNLWGVAKWLINLNNRILHGSRWFRLLIITVFLILPITLAGLMFSNGYVKQVQFASSKNVNELLFSGTLLSKLTDEQKDQAIQKTFEIIASNKDVKSILPYTNRGLGAYVFLTDKADRSTTSEEIVDQLNEKLSSELGEKSKNRAYFDLNLAGLQTGGPTQNYQIALAVKEEDSDKLAKASTEVGKLIKEQSCIKDEKVYLDKDCAQENKLVDIVDDGFLNKENLLLNYELDRASALKLNPLAQSSGLPASITLNRIIQSQFNYNAGKKVATVKYQNVDTDVLIVSEDKPETIEELNNKVSTSLGGINIDDIGEVSITNSKASILRYSGITTGIVQAKIKQQYQNNQTVIQSLLKEIEDNYSKDDFKATRDLNLEDKSIVKFSNGAQADAEKAFSQLGITLVLAIVLSYIVLAIFFNSFLQPLSVLYTIPITFLGVFPALYFFVDGQFGFLETIGLIILIGIVENVAIFLVDAANQKIREENWPEKMAIAYASGIRLRPVMLTKITTLVSLAPLAFTSEFYRSISVVIIFGLLISGFVSLITTPILFVFFRWVSREFNRLKSPLKFLFLLTFPIFIIVLAILDRPQKDNRKRVKVLALEQ
jgi:hydrophobic/amphiphilic exporter-1 (mainly G- bacteria), HAE1 family